MTVSASYQSNLTVKETLATGVDGIANPVVTHSQFNTNVSPMNAASTIAASKVASDTAALTAGAATIDLTSLPQAGGGTQSFTGLKVKAIKLICPEANANAITFVIGASNGYHFGATFKYILEPGQEITVLCRNAAVAVSGSVKNIDVTGTAAQSYSYIILAG